MSREERERHQAEGLCFRFYKPGHFTRNCPDSGGGALEPQPRSWSVFPRYDSLVSLSQTLLSL